MIKRSIVWTALVLIMGVIPTIAQPLSCPGLVEQALLAVGDNCGDLSRNSACYGYNQVDATFFDDMPEDYFAIPSDRAGLNEIDTLQTVPLDLDQSQWGIAVMNIQANIPNTVPGQGVLMMLLGGALVENDVHPDTANEILDPLSTVATTESNLHLSPSVTAEIIDVLPINAIVLVDGFNATRTWLRVVTDGVIGWIPAENVARLAAMDTLPTVGANTPTPMQAFYLTTGIGEVGCAEADSVIAIQSPENLTVDLTVNGVDIKVGSMITFKNLDDNTINLTVHRGEVTTIFGNTVSAGESAIGVINSAPEQAGVIVAWGEAVPATEEEKELGERTQAALNSVSRTNGWDERTIEPQSEDITTNTSGEVIHIVSTGETLFGIGRLYDTSLIAIVERNSLSEPYVLFSGDELVIPNPGSGFVGLPPREGGDTTPSTTSDDSSTDNTCVGLRLTSPLEGVPTESTTYYWDGIEAATQYQVNIYDAATGSLMGSLFTEDASTSIVFSAGQFGVGGSMQWEVIALVNGVPLCGTGLSQPLVHAAPVGSTRDTSDDDVDDKGDFDIMWKCVGLELEVSWVNANEDDTVDIKVTDDSDTTYSFSGSGESGSITVSYTGYNFIFAEAETSSGEVDTRTGDLFCN